MNKRSTKWYRKNEAEVMHRLGSKPTRNSGTGWIEKCDGENEHFICELKSTDHESFSIKQSVLHVLEHHALEAHKIPLFAFQFINRDEVWVAIKEEDIQAYRELIERDVLSKLEEYDSPNKQDNQELFDTGKVSPIVGLKFNTLPPNKSVTCASNETPPSHKTRVALRKKRKSK